MIIPECSLGKVVYLKDVYVNSENFNKAKIYFDYSNGQNKKFYHLIGHIVGFEINCTNETIVIVKWNNGKEYSVHPDLLIDAVAYKEEL